MRYGLYRILLRTALKKIKQRFEREEFLISFKAQN